MSYQVRNFTIKDNKGNTVAENVPASASAEDVYFTVGEVVGDTEITLQEMVFGTDNPSSNAKNLHGRITTLENKKNDITSIPTSDIENKIKNDKNNENLANGAVLTYEGFKKMRDLESYQCIISGSHSHVEGKECQALSNYAHAEGRGSIAKTYGSHAEGVYCEAETQGAHAEGYKTYACKPITFKKTSTLSAYGNHAEGYQTQAYDGAGTHAEGVWTIARGSGTHAEGYNSIALDTQKFSYGTNKTRIISNLGAHVEGNSCETLGEGSHAEGYQCKAYEMGSHAEGYKTIAGSLGSSSDPWGAGYAHAEGQETQALAYASHTGGYGSKVTRYASQGFAHGDHVIANQTNQFVIGKYNDTTRSTNRGGSYKLLFVIGGGAETIPKNLFEVWSDGAIFVNGTQVHWG